MRECDTFRVTSVTRLRDEVLAFTESYCKKIGVIKIKPKKPKTKVAVFRVIDRSCLDTFELTLHNQDNSSFTVVFEDTLPNVEDLLFCNLDTGHCQLHVSDGRILVDALIAFQNVQDRIKNKG